jgi:ATP/ADP translocase/HEAT repeat protein
MTITNSKSEELNLVLVLILHSFFIGLPRTFTFTASWALFLDQYGAADLPYVYMGLAIACTFSGLIYMRAQKKLPFGKLLSFNLTFLLAGILILRGMLSWSDARWPALVLAIWAFVEMVLTSLEFWPLCSKLLDVRQGKRLFGVIGSGEVFSGIIGGFATPWLVASVGTSNLLFLSAAGLAVSLVLLTYIRKAYAVDDQIPDTKIKSSSDRPMEKEKFTALLKNKYVLLLLLMPFFSVLSLYILDNSFNTLAKLQYPDTDQLAGFFGMFSAVISLCVFLGKTFLAGPLLAKFGIRLGLLSNSITVLVFASAFSVAGFQYGVEPLTGIVFWLLVATRGMEKISRNAIYVQAVQLTYQPLDSKHRVQVQTAVEAIIEPITCGLAGALILFLTKQFAFNSVQLIYVALVTLTLGVAIAMMVVSEYTHVLAGALKKRNFGALDLGLEDKSTIELLKKKLESPYIGEVLYSLNILENLEPTSLNTMLEQLMEHENSEVRKDIYGRLQAIKPVGLCSKVEDRIEKETDSELKSAALQTLCALNEEAFETVVPFLDAEDANIRKGAMIGLLKNGGIEGIVAAGERLTAMANSEDESERVFAAKVFGEVAIGSFHRPLIRLLNDECHSVKKAALEAAPKLQNPKLWKHVVKHLYDQSVRADAMNALVKAGPSVLYVLEKEFNKEEQTPQIRSKIARICGLIGGKEAIEFLRKRYDFPVEAVRHAILMALKRCGYQATDDTAQLNQLVKEEAESSCWVLASMVDIGETDASKLLHSALRNEWEKSRQRIFALLSFLYDSDTMNRVAMHLTSDTRKNTVFALELLDNLLSKDLRDLVFPIVDDIPFDLRLKRLNQIFKQPALGRDNRLREIIFRSDKSTTAWTKSCALYMIGKASINSLYDAVVAALSSPEEIVRETAVWTVGQLAPDNLTQTLSMMMEDVSRKVRDFARFVLDTVGLAGMARKSCYLKSSGQYEVEFFAAIILNEKEHLPRRKRVADLLGRLKSPMAAKALAETIIHCNSEGLLAVVLKHLCRLSSHLELVRPRLLEECSIKLLEHKDQVVMYQQVAKQNEKQTLAGLFSSHEEHIASMLINLLYLLKKNLYPKKAEESVSARMIASKCTKLDEKMIQRMEQSAPDQEMPEKDISLEEIYKSVLDSAQMFSLLSRAQVLVEIGETQPSGFDSIVSGLAMAESIPLVVQEAAIWAFQKLDPMQFDIFSDVLKNDPQISDFVTKLEKESYSCA